MKKKWTMYSVLLKCALTISMSQMKVPPVMTRLSEAFGISLTQASWLMSIFTLAGVFLAIPSAAIINRIGTKKLLLGLMVVLCIGNVIGGVAPNYTVLLIGRCSEGIAFAMIIVDALTMINGGFGDHAGVAIGIFSTYATVSSFVTMNACLPIVHFLGIRSLWFIIATLACLCIGLAYMVIEEPKIDTKSQQLAFREVMGNGKMGLAGIA